MERLTVDTKDFKTEIKSNNVVIHYRKIFICPNCGEICEFFYALRNYCENKKCKEVFVNLGDFHYGRKEKQLQWYTRKD